jgi:hypothetical protein
VDAEEELDLIPAKTNRRSKQNGTAVFVSKLSAFPEIMWRRRPRLQVAAASRRQVPKGTGTVL